MRRKWRERDRVRRGPVYLGLLVLLLLSGAGSQGCTESVEALQRTYEAKSIVNENHCRMSQQMLSLADEEFRAREPRKARRMQVGTREWLRYLDQKRYLMMAVTCESVREGPGPVYYYRAPDGTIACKAHGPLMKKEARRMSEYKTEAEEAAEFVQDEVDAGRLGLWIMGFGALLGLGAAWFHLGAEEEEVLLDALRAHPDTPADQVRVGGIQAVWGQARTEEPLVAPRVREEVVYYEYLQYEEWETKTRNGNWVRSEKVHKEERVGVPFFVEDESGRVQVYPGGARLETTRLHKETKGIQGGGAGGVGGGSGMSLAGSYRNHRHVHLVRGIPVGSRVLVLGEVGEGADSRPGFQRGEKKGEDGPPYLISTRTREEMIEKFHEQSAIRRMLVTTLGAFGVLLFLGGWFVPM